MTTADNFWATIDRGGKVIEMKTDECMELLAAMSVGRLAYSAHGGIKVLPVNYALFEDRIVFRTLEDGEISRFVPDAQVGFEVDDLEEFLETGWSVLVSAPAQQMTDDEVALLPYDQEPTPWAEGPRTLHLAIPCDAVTGRRVLQP